MSAQHRIRALQAQLDRARAVMIRAMDALESDADLAARREAFGMIQDQFDGVSIADHERAKALIPTLTPEPDPEEDEDDGFEDSPTHDGFSEPGEDPDLIDGAGEDEP